MAYCPHCDHDLQFGYVQPWSWMKCPQCLKESYADEWLGEDGVPLGDPFEDAGRSDGGAHESKSATHLVPLRPAPDSPTVFISYSHVDTKIATAIARFVRHQGAEVWIDGSRLVPGDPLIDEIEDGLRSCSVFLALMSRASQASPWVREEIRAALTARVRTGAIRVVPVLIEDVELPPMLAALVHVDFRHLGGGSQPWDALKLAICGRRDPPP